MLIPLIDSKKQYEYFADDINKAVIKVLSSGIYIMGESVIQFEKKIEKYLGVKHAIATANGTDALVIALKSLGIGKGDEVITTPYTFFATAESIALVGAKPVFADVEKDSFNIDIDKIEEKISTKTKAILPVHIFGQPVDIDSIKALAKKYNLYVLEDACQAIGAEYKGKKIGTFGDAACFSFYPTKNLGCAGDGGMIVTNNDRIAAIARALRVHGSGENGRISYGLINNIYVEKGEKEIQIDDVYNPSKYHNYLIGHNSRLDNLQAAILGVKFEHLEENNNRRLKIAEFYDANINNVKILKPVKKIDRKHVYHLYILQSEERSRVIKYLKEKGISTGIYYSIPIHLQTAFDDLGYRKGDFPSAEFLSERCFAIPMYPELTDIEQKYIVNAINDFI